MQHNGKPHTVSQLYLANATDVGDPMMGRASLSADMLLPYGH